jgi:glycosyltransferase involved in cell wall biosynthesis
MQTPLISVILPVYNCEKYISTAIQSILNQTYSNFELIIINDNSTDNSEKEINAFKDPRIKYNKNPENLKLIQTLNIGIQLSKGEYIARMDADDISYPERFEKQIIFLEKNKEVGVLGTSFKLLKENSLNDNRFEGIIKVKYPFNSEEIAFELIYNNVILHPSVMFRKSIFDQHKTFYNIEYTHAEEYYLWTELILKTKFANLEDCLLEYRVHDSQISNNYSEIQLIKTLEIQRKYLNRLGFKLNDLETKLLIEFLQRKELKNDEIRILIRILNDFVIKLQSLTIIDQKHSLSIILKKLKNIIINCKTFNIQDFYSNKLIQRIFLDLTIKQKIAFLRKQKI